MNKFLLSSLLRRRWLLALIWLCQSLASASSRPNIILIMSDDMGFSDIGCYGGEMKTPNLDSLAKNGLRFTQFYNTARCCPTRASLLTGLYPHQAGIGHMTGDTGHIGYRGNLNRESVTIAEVLRTGGYRTYMCGKWHVTRFDGKDDDNSNWPVQRGFEKFYGTIRGGGNFYDPTALCRQNTFITPENDPEYKPEKFYYTDAISDNAVQFLQQHTKESADKPFFMYVAYTAAHWPMHALEKDVEKYKGHFDGGYEPVRQARIERLKEMGLIDPKWTVSPPVADWNNVTNKAWEARCKEVYAAMIDNMDQGIGRIVAQLKKDGRFENTLIFFLQDNGGCAEDMGRSAQKESPPTDLKPFGPNDLQSEVWPPMQTRDGRWVRTGPDAMPGPADTYVAYGRGWANVSNTPFREYKHWVHEGGISTPLIAHWPNGISSSRRGKLETQPGHLIDIMATCVNVSGVEYPKEFRGEAIKPMEGVNLQSAFKGRSLSRRNPIFWEHEGNRAIRDGKWKLVAKENEAWELYDMKADRTEMNNLAGKNPKRVKELEAKWETWAARANVLPLGSWRGKNALRKNEKVVFDQPQGKQKLNTMIPGKTLVGARTSLSAAGFLKYKALFFFERTADKDVRAPNIMRFLLLSLFCLAGLDVSFAAEPTTNRPNIIVILTDDMGYGDVGCYGGKFVPTPNIDRLAREGTRFTQYYSASPICSPSRAGLLTGMFPARWRITSFLQTQKGNRACSQDDFLDPNAPSIARTLKASGYVTGHFGKWHLGGGRDVTNAPLFAAYGFDEHASTWESPEPHPDITATNWIWSFEDKVKRWDRSGFFVDKTLDFLSRHKSKPCYVNLWPDDVHTPWVPRAPRHTERMPDNEPSFRAVLAEYDRQIGRLLDGLKTLGLEKNTLVIFTSDNGPMPTLDGARAGGLRGSKLSLYEGGIRMPFIVRWPARTPVGKVDETTVFNAVDLFPTFCTLAQSSLPKNVKFDGEDLSAALSGKASLRKKPMLWEYGRNPNDFKLALGTNASPNVAVRDGNWKLLINADGAGTELYDLEKDPNERSNQASQNPKIAARLSEEALRWRKSLP